MSNKYGYFVYSDYVEGNEDAYPIIANFNLQEKSILPLNLLDKAQEKRSSNFKDWATFEKGYFDFEKPLWTTKDKEVFTVSKDLASINEPRTYTFLIRSDKLLSTSGIYINTLNEDFTIALAATEQTTGNVIAKSYEKSDDDFYSFVCNDFNQMVIDIVLKEDRFLKILGFSIGKKLNITENLIIDEPEIISHFSLTNDEFEYDTLDFTMIGTSEELNFLQGQKIRDSRTKKNYYINDFVYNNDGTISVTAYDAVCLLEEEYHGARRNNQTSISMAKGLYSGDRNALSVDGTMLLSNQTFSGTIEPTTFREASRLFARSNAFSLKKLADDEGLLFTPKASDKVVAYFNENNIVDGVPEITNGILPSKITFKKHRSIVDKSDELKMANGKFDADGEPKYERKQGYSIVFEDVLESGIDADEIRRIYFSQPVINKKFYFYYEGDEDKDKEFVEIGDHKKGMVYATTNDSQKKVVNDVFKTTTFTYETIGDEIIESGPWYVDFIFDTTYGVPPNIMFTGQACIDKTSDISTTEKTYSFNDSEIVIDDCYTYIEMANYNEFRKYLRYIYQFVNTVKFSSILEADAGDKINIKFNITPTLEFNSTGWVVSKKDTKTGVYEYEVKCR